MYIEPYGIGHTYTIGGPGIVIKTKGDFWLGLDLWKTFCEKQ